MEKFKTWCLNAWDWIASPFRKFSAWAGGPSEKRNLLGWGIDITWGLITLPFKLVYGVFTFGKMLFKEPKQAFSLVAYQFGRVVKSFGAMLHVYHTDRYGNRRIDTDRVLLVAWAWIIGSMFAVVLGPVGGWLLLGCFVAFIASGLPAAKITWKETTFQDWQQKKQEREDQAQVDSARSRVETARNVADLADQKAEIARQWAEVQAAQARAAQLTKDAGALIEAAKQQADARLIEEKE